MKSIDRRRFLKGVLAGLGAWLLARCRPAVPSPPTVTSAPPTAGVAPSPTPTGAPPTPAPQAAIAPTATSVPSPTATATSTPSPTAPPSPPRANRVAHVHSPAATYWDFASGWYGDHVDQAVVDAMVEEGLRQLTGASSAADAWTVLLPDYRPGQKIAIKVNFNNSDRNGGNCSQQGNIIDGLPQPVLALVRTLVEGRGVDPADIWIYDATVGRGRFLPDRFRLPIQAAYPGIVFWGRKECAQPPPFDHVDESLRISFSAPTLTDRWLTDLLYWATYLINIPILKRHGIHPVTLGFKNHFGSIDNVVRGGEDDLHQYLTTRSPLYQPTLSPLVDIYANPNIAGKTVLTMGDGLFGAPGAVQPPIPWKTFGGAPNSLFFSRDPVAIDCVMCDLLRSEWRGIPGDAYDYLRLAADRGLGTFEAGDPWGSGYRYIDYVRVDL
ncbi:MAG TPA: DUF362 domain-containing protein [Chloroflexi bacterium]|nr:DUF362 domain-containing protein [Chloroflexota bacterium]